VRKKFEVRSPNEELRKSGEFFVLNSDFELRTSASADAKLEEMTLASASATCPRCNGSGWVPIEGDAQRVEPCACQGDLRRRQRITAAGIPPRYYHCRLETLYPRNNSALVSAKSRVQEFADAWLPGINSGGGLLMMGLPGSGKTHLAVAALLEIIDGGKPGRLLFSNFQDLIQEIQASFDSDEAPSKSEIMRPLLEADLLVLDELGSQKPSLFVQDILYYLINTRYNAQRTTIFTTNYSDNPPVKEESLANRISERLRSRLYEMTEEIKLAGVPDYRRTFAQHH
jgi:DNA replication protein DnaC